MRVSQLLGMPVRRHDGSVWGVVVDVLVELPQQLPADAWHVEAVVVAPPRRWVQWPAFVGAGYARQRGPWPLTSIGRRTARDMSVLDAQLVVWGEDALVADPAWAGSLREAGL